MTLFERLAYIIGRVLLGFIFLASGAGKIMGWSGTAMYMQSKGMPAVPFFLGAAIVVEILGGLSVMTGIKLRQGSLLLFLFLIPVTFVFHRFWGMLPGPEQQMQMA